MSKIGDNETNIQKCFISTWKIIGQSLTVLSKSMGTNGCQNTLAITKSLCNKPAKRKRLGRSGTFMAESFRRWSKRPGFDPSTIQPLSCCFQIQVALQCY